MGSRDPLFLDTKPYEFSRMAGEQIVYLLKIMAYLAYLRRPTY